MHSGINQLDAPAEGQSITKESLPRVCNLNQMMCVNGCIHRIYIYIIYIHITYTYIKFYTYINFSSVVVYLLSTYLYESNDLCLSKNKSYERQKKADKQIQNV